jgi:hypothetical protein
MVRSIVAIMLLYCASLCVGQTVQFYGTGSLTSTSCVSTHIPNNWDGAALYGTWVGRACAGTICLTCTVGPRGTDASDGKCRNEETLMYNERCGNGNDCCCWDLATTQPTITWAYPDANGKCYVTSPLWIFDTTC